MSRPRHFEDWRPGEVLTLGQHRITAEEIKAFAAAFDPQPFHLDEAAAERSMFGGLIASGWHSCAILMRLFATAPGLTAANIASPGVDDLQWPVPVRPGDVLHGEARVLDCRPSASKPDRGLVRFEQSLHNQRGEVAVRLVALALYRRRPASGDASPLNPATKEETTWARTSR